MASPTQANEISAFWNERFGQQDYVYGKQPNEFFKSVISKLPVGKLLVPGAGEGRDAVYAATLGWQVHCLDLSDAGKEKALQLAGENNVTIQYDVADISTAGFEHESFDAVASIFFHLPPSVRSGFFHNAHQWLNRGGIFLMEGFTLDQLNYTSGGPKDPALLYNESTIGTELTMFQTLNIQVHQPSLNEGPYHSGIASVLDYVGLKTT